MEEKSEFLEFTLSKEDEGRSLENILRSKYGFSRGMIRKLKRWQGVSLNGKTVRLKDSGRENDRVRVVLREREESWIIPEKMPLKVLYEDEDVLVVDKEPGMLVHPVSREKSGTVANAVLYRWAQQGMSARFRPVFRLDRDTSGLLMIAKNSFAHYRMVEQMKAKIMRRRYLAVAQGKINENEGVIDFPIAPDPGGGGKRTVSPGGKRAVTRFWVLKRFASATFLRLELETGRTHQIRAHLAYLGFPLMGDSLYGGETGFIARQALHSAELKFLSPRNGREVLTSSPLPGDMVELLSVLNT